MLSNYTSQSILDITGIYSMECNSDNVNKTDRVMYFILQELTSHLVTGPGGLPNMRRVTRVAGVVWRSSWTEVSYINMSA